MKLFIQSIMIFLGTLITAAVVALGEPVGAELAIMNSAMPKPATLRPLQGQHKLFMPEWSATAALLVPR